MRVRTSSGGSHLNPNGSNNSKSTMSKYSYFEFKFLYFKIQEIIDKKVVLSLKYEQLKSPEIHLSLVKPIVTQIIQFGDNKFLAKKLNRMNPNIPMDYTPRFGATSARYEKQSMNRYYNSINDGKSLKISTSIIFILLLLRYEYLIQSENNLISYELLTTKANLCETLAIRMLREYDSFNRINQLFQTPLKSDLLAINKRHSFNTLELSVLSKSKKFLSQPVIVRILDRFYNGELIFKNITIDDEEQGLIQNKEITNYQYTKISLNEIIHRSNIVPKYQSLVINLRLILFMIIYFLIIFWKTQPGPLLAAFQMTFWLIAINLNIELLLKLYFIEFRFIKMIIWYHIDFILLLLIDVSFILYLLGSYYFDDLFSLIPIVLLPRILSILNNYQFFNLIIASLSKMALNLVGLICLFFSLISGFYFSFITLSNEHQTNASVLFDMVKIFFGFTPSVWTNWNDYNVLGKAMLMAYLFLIQFIVGSILAIVLSGVFAKVHQNNHEDFNNFKATNLILYFKIARLNYSNSGTDKSGSTWTTFCQFPLVIIHSIIYFLRIPIIIVIYIYELLISFVYTKQTSKHQDLKHFTFLSPSLDYYGDDELVKLMSGENNRNVSRFGMENDYDNVDELLLILKPRMNSAFKQIRRGSKVDSNFTNKKDGIVGSLPSADVNLYTTKSISTLGGGNLRSASTDSLFIYELLNKRYGDQPIPVNVKEKSNETDLHVINEKNNPIPIQDGGNEVINQEILQRLERLEQLLMKQYDDNDNDDKIKQEYNSIINNREVCNSVVKECTLLTDYELNNLSFNSRVHRTFLEDIDPIDALLEVHEIALINSEAYDEVVDEAAEDNISDETIGYESDDTF